VKNLQKKNSLKLFLQNISNFVFNYFPIPSNSFEGIIFNLKTKYPEISSIVNISASTTGWGNISNLLDWNNGQWFSNNIENSYFILKFKRILISICEYSLKSGSEDYPKSWKVECLNEKNEWCLIDTKSNREELCSKYASHSFPCNSNFFFSSIKFTQTGKTSHSRNNFQLSSIELYGSIKII
jgi:hypothetical protein